MLRVFWSALFIATLVSPAAAHKRASKARAQAIPVYKRSGEPNIQAESAVVLDLDRDEELLTKNADFVRPIASISKLMAIMVVLENTLNLDGETAITESDRQIASGGARSRLLVGQSFVNRDLLHAALMASDNRAVPALGRAVGLSPSEMVAAMNLKARTLSLQRTHFEDPVGLNSQNRSTARDVAGMLKAAISFPLIAEITQKARVAIHPVGKPNWLIEYNNTDMVARNSRFDVLTGKTGYTDLARYCLAIAVRLTAGNCSGDTCIRHPVAMVFLGAVGKMTRFGDFHRTAQWLSERRLPKHANAKVENIGQAATAIKN